MKIITKVLVLGILLSFTVLQARSIFMESLATNAALKMGQKKYLINKKYEEGLLGKGESAYKTFNFYKGIKYAISVGLGEKIKSMSVYLYDENYNLVKESKIPEGSLLFPTFEFEPENSGSYYLKISVNDGGKSDNEWMIIYGYKN